MRLTRRYRGYGQSPAWKAGVVAWSTVTPAVITWVTCNIEVDSSRMVDNEMHNETQQLLRSFESPTPAVLTCT